MRHGFQPRPASSPASRLRTRLLAVLSSAALVLGLSVLGGASAGVANADPGASDYVNGIAITFSGGTGTTGTPALPVIANDEPLKVEVWYNAADLETYVESYKASNGGALPQIVITFTGANYTTFDGSHIQYTENTVINNSATTFTSSTLTFTLADPNTWQSDLANGMVGISFKVFNTGDPEIVEPTVTSGFGNGSFKFASFADGDEKSPSAALIQKTVHNGATSETKSVGIDVSSGTPAFTVPTDPFDFQLRMVTTSAPSPAVTTATATINDTLGSSGLEYVCDLATATITATITRWDTDGLPTTGTPVDLKCSDITVHDTSSPQSFELPLSAIADAWPGGSGSAPTDLPGNTEIKVNYKVKATSVAVDQSSDWTASVDGSNKNLYSQYDAIWNGANKTSISVSSDNTATFPITAGGKTTAKATVKLEGNVEPGVGFDKQKVTPKDLVYVAPNTFVDEHGSVIDLSSADDPLPQEKQVEVTYTLSADLTRWSEKKLPNPTADVYITDTLPAQMEWNIPVGGLTASGTIDGAAVTTIDESTVGCDSATPDVGKYCLSNSERTLVINVGQDVAAGHTKVTVTAPATIKTFKGLNMTDNNPSNFWLETTATEAKAYAIPNTATFSWDGVDRYTTPARDRVVYLVDLGTPGAELHDVTVFKKEPVDATGNPVSSTTKVNPGESAVARYRFTIDPVPPHVAVPKPIHPDGLTIEDTLSGSGVNQFDLSVAGTVAVDVKYNGAPVANDKYTVSLDNAAHKVTVKFIDGWLTTNDPIDHKIVVTITLTSKPLAGKVYFELDDAAKFTSSDSTINYVDSVSDGAITSWGNEASATKLVSDGTSGFTSNLRVELEPDGALADPDKIYLYQLEVVPHGSYGNGSHGLITIDDIWPSQLGFCGLVQGGSTPFDLGIDYSTVACDSSKDTLTVHTDGADVSVNATDLNHFTVGSSSNFKWDAEKPLYIYVAAKIKTVGADKFVKNQPIVNKFGRSSATITPVGDGDIPLSVSKQDVSFNPSNPGDPSPIEDDPHATFQLWRSGTLVVDDIAVCGGQLRLLAPSATDCNAATAVTVRAAGDYDLYEIVPPAGNGGIQYVRAADPLKITVSVDGTTVTKGTTDPAVFWNNRVAPGTVSLGDLVWWDKNHDGKQDASEPGLGNVKLILCEVDVNGNVTSATIGGKQWSTTTNALGYYSFDGLPVLNTGHEYVVCIDRTDSTTQSVLSPFLPTLEHAVGTTTDNDSSLWSASTDQGGPYDLGQPGTRDPSLDFGFYKPSTGGGGNNGGGSSSPSTSPTTSPVTTTTTVVTTPTTATTTPTRPTVNPSSATSPTRPVPPTNVPPTTIAVQPNECTDLVEHGFEPGETVTITVTGEHGQYELTAVADQNGDVAFCLQADQPETLTIEVLGENQAVVREVVIGVEGLGYTGMPTAEYLTLALLLIGAGVGLVLFGRSRRRGLHSHG